MIKILRGYPKQGDPITCIKKKKNDFMEQSTYANSPPKAPTQKAQQGVSIRKCNRSLKPKKAEEISKICEKIKRFTNFD